MRLIGIRDRLVKEKRIRPEDMHIMANIFLPSNEFNEIERISQSVILTYRPIYYRFSTIKRACLSRYKW